MKTPMNEPITMFKKQFNFLSIAVPPSKIPIFSILQIVKETIGVGVNEKAVLRFYQTALSFTSISIFPW